MTEFLQKAADFVAQHALAGGIGWLTDKLIITRILPPLVVVLFLLGWVMMSAALWRMAKASGLSHGWTACLPVGQARILGRLSDACVAASGGPLPAEPEQSHRHTRRLTAWSVVLTVVLILCMLILNWYQKEAAGIYLNSLPAQEGEVSAGGEVALAIGFMALLGVAFLAAVILIGVVAPFVLILHILQCEALWPLFKARSPRYAVLFEILTVFCFPLGAAILLCLTFVHTQPSDTLGVEDGG